MIPITRKLVKTLRSVFRAALGLSARAEGPPINVRAGGDGLFFSAALYGRGIQFRLEGSFPNREFWLPFDFLRQTEGSGKGAVLLEPQSEGVDVQWMVDSVPQTRTLQVDDPPDGMALPDVEFTDNSPELLVSLANAVQTCDKESLRYALNCVLLRGESGEVVATDSHQLLVESGFTFPWDDNVLLPAGRLMTHREFRTDENVGIGRADDVLVLKVGPWTAWMSLETERRFPDVESVIPGIDGAMATVRIPKDDREFLARAVQQLPADDERHSPVTVDLNGNVAVRARASETEPPTELVLARSHRTGMEVRFCTNRKLLARAMQLGFDDLHIFGPDDPVLCADGQRKYVWMLLDKDGVVKPSKHATRIESAAHAAESPTSSSTPLRNPTPMKRTNPTRNNGRTNGSTPADSSMSVINRAESLRDSLQTAITDVRELINALKQQKKNSRSVQSALKSLRQLEGLEV